MCCKVKARQVCANYTKTFNGSHALKEQQVHRFRNRTLIYIHTHMSTSSAHVHLIHSTCASWPSEHNIYFSACEHIYSANDEQIIEVHCERERIVTWTYHRTMLQRKCICIYIFPFTSSSSFSTSLSVVLSSRGSAIAYLVSTIRGRFVGDEGRALRMQVNRCLARKHIAERRKAQLLSNHARSPAVYLTGFALHYQPF